MIKLYIGQAIIDLSNYIDVGSIVYSDTIDETKAHGGFTIPYIKLNAIVGLDMSKPLTPLTKIELTVDDEVTYWKLSEDKVRKVRKGATPLYRHDITMIEPTIDLTLRPLPDMTITQPKGVIEDYIYEVNQIDGETTIDSSVDPQNIDDGYETTGVQIDNTLTSLSFTYGQSNDITIINDNVLKEIREYTIELTYQLYNIQFNQEFGNGWFDSDADIKFYVYADGVEIFNFTQHVPEGSLTSGLITKIVPYRVNSSRAFLYTPSSANETITVKAETLGLRNSTVLASVEDEIWITGLSLSLLTYEEGFTGAKITLDEAVDKILLIINQAPKQLPSQEFSLDVGTRNRIKTILSPDMTFSGYTVYEALQELASYVGAIVYIGEDDWTTIHFYFYDTNRIETNITYLDEETESILNDYVTGYEINARNVVKENNRVYEHIDPSETGWLSIRAEEIGVINDTNAIFETTLPIYYESRILVKGLEFDMVDSLSNPVNFTATTEWDITDFVVEQTKWRGLENTSNADNRNGDLNKGNTLYYIKGSKNIHNITYNDVILAPAWNKQLAANYAIVEAILCKAIVDNPTYTFTSTEYKPSVNIFNLRVRLYYMAYSNARATVYKDNSGELNEAIRYFNEQSNINDMKRLGDMAKESVNRRGNPISRYRGMAKNVRNLVHLGMENSKGEKLLKYNISITPTVRYLVLDYSKYNPNISNFVGTPSEYRQWEIPNTDLVYRKDKYKEFVYISENNETPTFTIYEIQQIMANFKTTPDGNKLTYAQLELDYDGLGYTEKIEATVDVLAFGTTTAIQIELKDNYSAGGRQIDGTVYDGSPSGITQTRQTDTRYTDNFGRIENVKVSIYTTHAISDSDNYPDNNDVIANPESQLELVIKKDAREIWGLTQELIFRSIYQNVKVYSGMAMFNGMVAKGSSVQTQPFLLKKGYVPTERLDTTKLIQATWTSVIIANELYTQFTTPIGEYEGYVWVETKTNTPIFSVQTSVFDTTTVQNLGHEVYMFTTYGSTSAFYLVNLSASMSMTDNITIELSTDVEIDLIDTLVVEGLSSETDFIFPIVNLSGSLAMSDTLDIELSTDYEIDLVDTMGMSSTIVDYRSTNYVVDLAGSMAITDTINIEVSTDVEVALVDDMYINSSITHVKSVDYVTNLSVSMSMSDTITIEKSTDYETTLSDTLVLEGAITDEQTVTQWTYIGTTGTQDQTVTYVSSGSDCVMESVARSWLTTNYPPTNYAYGYVIRVTRANENLSPCSPAAYYYQAS